MIIQRSVPNCQVCHRKTC